MSEISSEEIIRQSENAVRQWDELWTKHAKHVAHYNKKSLEDFRFHGVGKSCVLVGNGWTFQKEIEVLKENKDNVDIICCDKTLGHLLDNGIKPTFCLVCDASVDYEKYMEKWKDKLDETILFTNVCSNPKWTDNGNWKDKYFFVNRDVLKSEEKYGELSNCTNYIPAATNVSGAMLVFLVQATNKRNQNLFGYDKYSLIGYDYCWHPFGHYYAFDKYASGKKHYMAHELTMAMDGEMVNTSSNLLFSVRWLKQYIDAFSLPVVNCSTRSILDVRPGRLDKQISYSYKREDKNEVLKLNVELQELLKGVQSKKDRLNNISTDHYKNYLASL